MKLKKAIYYFFEHIDRFIEIHIVDSCNLNCKSCAHFSPLAEPNYIDINDLEKMYKNLSKNHNIHFNRIRLLGGEPLLHQNITNIIILTRKYFPHKRIEIVTNGLLISKMNDTFFKECKNNRIYIYVSQYTKVIDYTNILKILKDNHVKYYISSPVLNFKNYYLDPKATNKKQNENYKNCQYGGKCLQLRNNKLYPCYTIAYIEYLNKFFNMNFKESKDDYIKLDHKISKKEFKKITNKSVPFCKYCNMEKVKNIKWETSKKNKNEWIIE